MLDRTQPTRPLELDRTQPTRPIGLDALQPIPVIRSRRGRAKARHPWQVLLLALLAVYFFAPLRTNILLLGTDDSELRGAVGRTDTIILTTLVPLKPYIGMMGIPRDLWLPIPGAGEQRINTAYFFAESQRPGSGPAALENTIEQDFGIPVDYYAVIHMDGLVQVIDALGGVDIVLEHKTAGLKRGQYHMDGMQALAFARERYSSDDFSRMQQGQILIRAIAARMISPESWPRLAGVMISLSRAVQTNVPFWQWPRLAFCILRTGLFGVDSRTIPPEMVYEFTTSGGGQVLGPNWEAIHPTMKEMFGN